jgi:hypothetical protein
LFFLFSIGVIPVDRRRRNVLLGIIMVALVLFVGSRDILAWSDTGVYQLAFNQTKPLSEFSWYDQVYGYSERGFFFLGVLVKTFTNSIVAYFTFVAAITYLFLFDDLRKYCIYPFIGLCIYLARFMTGREMTQIRAALAIAVVIWGTRFVKRDEYWKCLAIIILAYYFHTSAIVALPMLFFNKFTFSKTQIYWGLVLSFIIAGFYGGFIKDLVSSSDFVNEMARSYVEEGSEKAWSNDLTNPMIYYQSFLLLLFTYYEDKLSKLSPYYYIIRNAYFYCTVILIVLCQYAILAARTSTIFATYEIVMIPLLLLVFRSNNRWISYSAILAFYSIMFYLNWSIHIS